VRESAGGWKIPLDGRIYIHKADIYFVQKITYACVHFCSKESDIYASVCVGQERRLEKS